MQEKIREMLKDAMRSKDQVRLSVYRSLISAFTSELLTKGKTPQDKLEDADCMNVIRRSIKQREDAANQYRAADRIDLAEPEEAEKSILAEFLPTQLSEGEVESEVAKILDSTKPLDPKSLGKYIGMCAGKLKEVASGDLVKRKVEEYINKNI